jgi:hypothetical protein
MFGLAGRHRLDVLAQAVIAGVAAVLLFWGLTDKYLWQDEAATAVLATRFLKFGRPIAYDGVNLITTDMFEEDEDAIGKLTTDPRAAVDHHVRRGEFKPDTTWKWQPWGLFAVAAMSFKLMGQTTLAARLPFALAGLATVVFLFRLVRRYSGSLLMAALAALFLVANPYWILHARQCRYYSLSSLFLVLTLLAYARWQVDGRGAAAFIAASWCWFQVDYGTVWPALAVLFLDAFIAGRQGWRRTTVVGVLLAGTIAPFFYYYQLWGRALDTNSSWKESFSDNLFNMNEYVAPALIVATAAILLAWRWKSFAPAERRLVAAADGILLALVLWIPTVSPYPFLRYAIIAAPAGGVVTAWLIVRGLASRAPMFALPCAAVLIATPWASLPLHALVPPTDWYTLNRWVRGEFSALYAQAFRNEPDPNRLVIQWLKKNAAPSDEILINYEDLPLMFYLPNPIRGGIAAFRVEDDARTPPQFVILRHSVDFVHWPTFVREVQRYQWSPVPLKAPDVPWGNNPDPMGQDDDPTRSPDLYFARRIGP